MEQVLGVGRVFILAKDREPLARWYRDHLGLAIDEAWWGAALPLSTEQDRGGACVVWSAFPHDTTYFGEGGKGFMINFRVHDLDAMLAQLRAAKCDVDDRSETNDFGSFGWVTDPEGNRVELWQPPETPPTV